MQTFYQNRYCIVNGRIIGHLLSRNSFTKVICSGIGTSLMHKFIKICILDFGIGHLWPLILQISLTGADGVKLFVITVVYANELTLFWPIFDGHSTSSYSIQNGEMLSLAIQSLERFQQAKIIWQTFDFPNQDFLLLLSWETINQTINLITVIINKWMTNE